MYTKYILNKDEIISIIALLSALRRQVKDMKDIKTKKEILNFMYANFNADDIIIFDSIERIENNTKYLELINN